MTVFEKARGFVYRNARPLELARWKFHFENGSADDVVTALSAFQNEDGGFSHALEEDNFNPNSLPMGVWKAAEILDEIGFSDKSHPIIKGMLRYLESGSCFDKAHDQWLNTVPSNNDYPCAIWWAYNGESDFRYNPTAALTGFILKFAKKDSVIYQKALIIAKQAVEWFDANVPFNEMHVTNCFVRLYECLCITGANVCCMDSFKEKLITQVNNSICRDTSKWGKEYVSLPADFIRSKDSIFIGGNEELLKEQCRLVKQMQLPDGSFPVAWIWCNDYAEYHIAANWWKSEFCIGYMRFIRDFEE